MLLQIVDVEYMGEYTLRCTFNNGSKKNVDMTPLLDAPAFKALRDIEKFKQFGLDDTIFWSNGADIAPEWLLTHGHDA